MTDLTYESSQNFPNKDEIREYTSQTGFQSTSSLKEAALNFARPPAKSQSQEELVSVLLKICLKSKNNFFAYNEKTTAFPEEKEVLLQEGLKF